MWNATPGETLTCIREQGNRNDVFSVAVQSDDNIFGHIPRQISCIRTLICRVGVLNCLIIGSRWYSSYLENFRLYGICMHAHTHIYKYIHAHAHTQNTHMPTCYTYTHTYIHTHIRTHIPCYCHINGYGLKHKTTHSVALGNSL